MPCCAPRALQRSAVRSACAVYDAWTEAVGSAAGYSLQAACQVHGYVAEGSKHSRTKRSAHKQQQQQHPCAHHAARLCREHGEFRPRAGHVNYCQPQHIRDMRVVSVCDVLLVTETVPTVSVCRACALSSTVLLSRCTASYVLRSHAIHNMLQNLSSSCRCTSSCKLILTALWLSVCLL
jgi:hypothetical protein